MKQVTLELPLLALVAGTRAILGAGAALLFADRLDEGQRKAAGWTLFLAGAVSTIPVGLMVLRRRHD